MRSAKKQNSLSWARISGVFFAIIAAGTLVLTGTHGEPASVLGLSPTLTGNWSVAPGNNGMQMVSSPAMRGQIPSATWRFRNLDKNVQYEVWTTWKPSERLSNNATYRLLDGAKFVRAAGVDQTSPAETNQEGSLNADEDWDWLGVGWYRLGVIKPASGEITVQLRGAAGQSVAAGPVRIVRYTGTAELSLDVTGEQVQGTARELMMRTRVGVYDEFGWMPQPMMPTSGPATTDENIRFLKYTIRLSNDGPDGTASDVETSHAVVDTELIDGVTLDVAELNNSLREGCDDRHCSFGTIATGHMSPVRTMYITVRARNMIDLCRQTVKVRFSVLPPEKREYVDPDMGNNERIVELKVCDGSDLWIDGSVEQVKRLPPDEQELLPAGLHLLRLTMTLGNNGPDPLPGEWPHTSMQYTLVRNEAAGGAYLTKFRDENWSPDEFQECDDYSCYVPAPNPGETVSRTLIGHIGSETCGKTVQIQFSTYRPQPAYNPEGQHNELAPGNNTKTVDVEVWCQPKTDLSVNVTSEQFTDPADPETHQITYTVTLKNHGPDTTPEIVYSLFSQREGPEISFESSAQCSDGRCNLPVLQPGESSTVTISGTAHGEDLCGTTVSALFKADASGEDGFTDPNPDNNEALIVTPIDCDRE